MQCGAHSWVYAMWCAIIIVELGGAKLHTYLPCYVRQIENVVE